MRPLSKPLLSLSRIFDAPIEDAASHFQYVKFALRRILISLRYVACYNDVIFETQHLCERREGRR